MVLRYLYPEPLYVYRDVYAVAREELRTPN